MSQSQSIVVIVNCSLQHVKGLPALHCSTSRPPLGQAFHPVVFYGCSVTSHSGRTGNMEDSPMAASYLVYLLQCTSHLGTVAPHLVHPTPPALLTKTRSSQTDCQNHQISLYLELQPGTILIKQNHVAQDSSVCQENCFYTCKSNVFELERRKGTDINLTIIISDYKLQLLGQINCNRFLKLSLFVL